MPQKLPHITSSLVFSYDTVRSKHDGPICLRRTNLSEVWCRIPKFQRMVDFVPTIIVSRAKITSATIWFDPGEFGFSDAYFCGNLCQCSDRQQSCDLERAFALSIGRILPNRAFLLKHWVSTVRTKETGKDPSSVFFFHSSRNEKTTNEKENKVMCSSSIFSIPVQS